MFRAMTLADLSTVLDWAADEGWNPGHDDAAAFLAADAAGFFVAERDGQPVAAISLVNHDPQVAFLGLYLCHPAFRGQGIGFALWSHALQHAGTRTIGLDGVAAQQANYAKSGFAPHGATLRLQGRMPPPNMPSREAGADDFAAMAALDRAANGYARNAFTAAWTTSTAHRRTVVIETATGIGGFATARLCRTGCKIGPVIAPHAGSAMALIAAAADRIGECAVTVDVPHDNTALIAALGTAGFVETFRTARMYRGPAPLAGATLQAIGTMELG
jgi:GNAT superfamily N-acetyltransferase